VWVGIAKVPVDRLENRQAPAGLEHPEELAKSLLLGFDVYEHGTGGDGVNRGVLQGNTIGGGQKEPALIQHSHLPGNATGVLQEIQRDVAKDDLARCPNLGKGAESYQPIACAHVKQSLTF